MTQLKKRLAEDIADEHQGAKTYAARARQLRRAGRNTAARTVQAMRRDEQRHARTLRTLRSH